MNWGLIDKRYLIILVIIIIVIVIARFIHKYRKDVDKKNKKSDNDDTKITNEDYINYIVQQGTGTSIGSNTAGGGASYPGTSAPAPSKLKALSDIKIRQYPSILSPVQRSVSSGSYIGYPLGLSNNYVKVLSMNSSLVGYMHTSEEYAAE